MKKTITFLLALFALTNNSYAIDRIVQENGSAGTFSTIGAAITASNDGDRIIIYPKIGGNPYIEDLVINKTLEFASAEDGVRYKIQGNISFSALNNRTITIINAHLVSGNMTGNGAGWRTNINIMGCILDGGDISLSNQYYGNVVSNILNNGSINLSHGRIIGNELVNETKQILISNSTSITNDTLNIIANKVPSINCSSDIFLNIRNNFIKRTTTPPSYFGSIYYAFNSGGINKLNIINNTILTPRINATGFDQVYYLNLSSPAIIKNNIFQRITSNATGNSPGYILSTNNSVSYNFYYNTSTIITSDINPTILASGTVDLNTGGLVLPTSALNGADPSFEYYDLDLSAGDAGCYGGSYTLDNYFPITGSSRVYNIDMPFGISTSGGALNIKADGFDR